MFSFRSRKKFHLSERAKVILTVVKYILPVVLTFTAYRTTKDGLYVAGGLFELLVIVLASDLLIRRWPIVGRIINSTLVFLYTVQEAILLFGSTFLSLVMLDNLGSLQALHGRAALYIGAFVLCIVLAVLPAYPIGFLSKSVHHFLSAALALELVFTLLFGNTFSPIFGYVELGVAQKARADQIESIRKSGVAAEHYYKAEIKDAYPKPESIPDNPNIVLIFTEGLSQNIVEDSRNIMPNVQRYEQEWISFTDYFNHTAATYRGLIGQLYSGFQFNNYDENKLVSIQQILKELGYDTTFVNTEPTNLRFSKYLDTFGFDRIDTKKTDSYIDDKEAYEHLYDLMEKKNRSGKPFFTAMYTFGTHASFDSDDEKFGDGTNPELNKFYNADYQFGKFMEKLKSGPMADNTVVIFTTDHCAYSDDAFLTSFPDYQRADNFLDRVPLLIYYKGVVPAQISVGGRNTLSLAPTILDLLDISAPNYFLGDSLFLGADNVVNELEIVYTIEGTNFMSTEGGQIQALGEEGTRIVQKKYNDYISLARMGVDGG